MRKKATWRNTPYAHAFYHSGAWKRTRALVWERDKGLCQRCMARGEITPADVVHHKVPLSETNMDDADITLNPGNLVCLCHDCHSLTHQELGVGALGTQAECEPRVRFDADGNIVRL
jgi:5-methylcytosine-specific restriction endonuclease McrA